MIGTGFQQEPLCWIVQLLLRKIANKWIRYRITFFYLESVYILEETE